jgi:hypothetical protein
MYCNRQEEARSAHEKTTEFEEFAEWWLSRGRRRSKPEADVEHQRLQEAWHAADAGGGALGQVQLGVVLEDIGMPMVRRPVLCCAASWAPAAGCASQNPSLTHSRWRGP